MKLKNILIIFTLAGLFISSLPVYSMYSNGIVATAAELRRRNLMNNRNRLYNNNGEVPAFNPQYDMANNAQQIEEANWQEIEDIIDLAIELGRIVHSAVSEEGEAVNHDENSDVPEDIQEPNINAVNQNDQDQDIEIQEEPGINYINPVVNQAPVNQANLAHGINNNSQRSRNINWQQIQKCNKCAQSLKPGDVYVMLRCGHLFHYRCLFGFFDRPSYVTRYVNCSACNHLRPAHTMNIVPVDAYFEPNIIDNIQNYIIKNPVSLAKFSGLVGFASGLWLNSKKPDIKKESQKMLAAYPDDINKNLIYNLFYNSKISEKNKNKNKDLIANAQTLSGKIVLTKMLADKAIFDLNSTQKLTGAILDNTRIYDKLNRALRGIKANEQLFFNFYNEDAHSDFLKSHINSKFPANSSFFKEVLKSSVYASSSTVLCGVGSLCALILATETEFPKIFVNFSMTTIGLSALIAPIGFKWLADDIALGNQVYKAMAAVKSMFKQLESVTAIISALDTDYRLARIIKNYDNLLDFASNQNISPNLLKLKKSLESQPVNAHDLSVLQAYNFMNEVKDELIPLMEAVGSIDAYLAKAKSDVSSFIDSNLD